MGGKPRGIGSVRSVNVSGPPRVVEWRGKKMTTGIFKAPVSGSVRIVLHQMEGDVQADLSVHGGPTKAVYAYPAEHYPAWMSELEESELSWGAFGENLTTEGLLEDEVRVGDVFRIGTAELMATEPRMPCSKLAARFGRADMQKRFTESGRSGIYLAVRSEGRVRAGDGVERIHRNDEALTIRDVVALRTGRRNDPDLFRRALEHSVLADDWKESLRRLAS